MQCRKCGDVLPDGTRVCPSCGEPVSSSYEPDIRAGAFPTASRPVVYAGFWLRALAYFLDVVLLTVIGVATILLPLFAKGAIPQDNPWFLFGAPSRQIVAIQLLIYMLSWLYFASFESSSWQATPGKRMVGLVVTDIEGRRITFARASGRFFGKFISQFLLFLGYVLAGFTPKKQALHDILAKCLVIRKPAQI